MADNNGFINMKQAAAYIGVHYHTIRKMLKRPDGPPAMKVTNAWKFRVSELDTWLESKRNKPLNESPGS